MRGEGAGADGAGAEAVQAAALRGIANDLDAYLGALIPQLEALPEYRTVPDSLGFWTRDVLVAILRALEMGTGPSPDDRLLLVSLGEERARQGVPLSAIVAAVHTGAIVLWDAVVARTAEADRACLIPLAGRVLAGLDEVLRPIADAYAATRDALDSSAYARAQRFVDLLAPGGDPEQAAILCAPLGFDPSGAFTVAMVGGVPAGAPLLAALPRSALDAQGRGVAVWQEAGRIVAVLQGVPDVVPLVSVLGAHSGIGAARTGLGGAARSLADAALALEVALSRGVPSCSFVDDWFACLVIGAALALEPVLGEASSAGADAPHLVEAVRAFAAAHGSTGTAAAALNLHPNSVTYRLDRWRAVTGLDVRTTDGLLRSLGAVELLGLRTRPGVQNRR